MVRPLRINYENAIYHVMNRGRGHNTIFHSKYYYETFLALLAECHNIFELDIISYCLMSNHYHLLVRTPLGNLSRCMRHINGVYTQRYNKMRKTDGPLFRGRYHAILVEEDNYLLQASRYIHRNPIETKVPMVNNLVSYKYSSYPIYLNSTLKPKWLNTKYLLDFFNGSSISYANFVEEGNDDFTEDFYQNHRSATVFGSDEFVEKHIPYIEIHNPNFSRKSIDTEKFIITIVIITAKYYKVTLQNILHSKRGVTNIPRMMAVYLAFYITKASMQVIAHQFNIQHDSSVSRTIKKIKHLLINDETLKQNMNDILNILSNLT